MDRMAFHTVINAKMSIELSLFEFPPFRDAWNKLGDLSSIDAVKGYIGVVDALAPGWSVRLFAISRFLSCPFRPNHPFTGRSTTTSLCTEIKECSRIRSCFLNDVKRKVRPKSTIRILKKMYKFTDILVFPASHATLRRHYTISRPRATLQASRRPYKRRETSMPRMKRVGLLCY
jgi:hypothetical protein